MVDVMPTVLCLFCGEGLRFREQIHLYCLQAWSLGLFLDLCASVSPYENGGVTLSGSL
jgi:hypothetical protein